jgi:hypothetical protein
VVNGHTTPVHRPPAGQVREAAQRTTVVAPPVPPAPVTAKRAKTAKRAPAKPRLQHRAAVRTEFHSRPATDFASAAQATSVVRDGSPEPSPARREFAAEFGG